MFWFVDFLWALFTNFKFFIVQIIFLLYLFFSKFTCQNHDWVVNHATLGHIIIWYLFDNFKFGIRQNTKSRFFELVLFVFNYAFYFFFLFLRMTDIFKLTVRLSTICHWPIIFQLVKQFSVWNWTNTYFCKKLFFNRFNFKKT